MNFRERWLNAVDKKNSVLCAGLDPAEFAMGRGEKGLYAGGNKEHWSLEYIEAVAPHCAAIKPNIQYWKGKGDMTSLYEITLKARDMGLVVIDDSKLADIGSTNDAGLFYSSQKGNLAVTVAPFAGNIAEIAQQAKNREIGAICMCLMSNPEYERKKNEWISVDASSYDPSDVKPIWGTPHVRQYIQLAHDANEFGLAGIVIGAPSEKNHISETEIEKAKRYAGDDMLVLLPGVGAQGGEADAIWDYFDVDKVIVNVGRALMFPNGSNSTPKQQADTAKHYKRLLNNMKMD